MDKLSETIQFMIDYPVERAPYPPGYPDDLKFDPYPGKDYIIGLCDETIAQSMELYPEAKDKELMKTWIETLKTVRQIRMKKLNPTPKKPEKVGQEQERLFE